MKLEVHKFGGTSMGDAERIARAADLLRTSAAGNRVVCVASAMAGVTNQLVAAAEGRPLDAAAILERHLAVLTTDEASVAAEIRGLLDEVISLLEATKVLGYTSPRARDRIIATGEKLSVRLLAAVLRRGGADAAALDADDFLETDARFGEASPLPAVTGRAIEARLRPLLEQGQILIVTGFCGRAPNGATTTLGRGGSDYSATLLAGGLTADRVIIWTDVDGVLTADPRVVPGARRLAQLNYREAAELSYYGAKVLHPRTIAPVAADQIPIEIRNSFAPEAVGTRIDGRFTPGSHPVKAISAVRGQALLSVEGTGMAGVPGVAARVFGALAEHGISVTMISQSSSEASICLALPEEHAANAEVALKRAFRADLAHGDVEEVSVRSGVALVAAVGLGMAHTPGIAGRVLGALGEGGVNVLAIAQGSSELNISVAVDQAQNDLAVAAIHQAFGLHRRDTGEDAADRLDVLLHGCGRVGRALMELLESRREHIAERFGLDLRVVGVADSRSYVFAPAGVPDLSAIRIAKAEGRGLPEGRAGDLLGEALGYRLARPVLVDLTAADGSDALFHRAFEGGCDVVTANKKPLAGPRDGYDALHEVAASHGRLIRAETTVGAGLPVIDTLEMLRATGDRVRSAEGALSGTLAFVIGRLEAGDKLSVAVRTAVDAGYTEPDPMEDLSGEDVGRKAVILARLAGLPDAPFRLEGLAPAELKGLPLDELFTRLEALDEAMAAKVAEAKSLGRVLRYTAYVGPKGITVGPVMVPPDSPVGRLSGTDNLIAFTSDRYAAQPLVVSGPGAGTEVTAMGVFGDVLRIAAERR